MQRQKLQEEHVGSYHWAHRLCLHQGEEELSVREGFQSAWDWACRTPAPDTEG